MSELVKDQAELSGSQGSMQQHTMPATMPPANMQASTFQNNMPGAATGRAWTNIEVILSLALLLFGLVVLGLEVYLITRAKAGWGPQSVLRLTGLTLIIVAALLLVIAGYSTEQAAPVIGLFGTIAGYLLGARDKAS